MPLRKPAPVTAARLNALQDTVLGVARDGKHDPIKIVCDPLRMRKGIDFTTTTPNNSGWNYDAAGGGYAYSTAGAGATFDDYGAIEFELEEGDEIVGFVVRVYRTSAVAGSMQANIVAIADGTFPPLSPLAGIDCIAPLGVWTSLTASFAAITTAGRSFTLQMRGSVSTPGQRYGGGYVLVQRP